MDSPLHAKKTLCQKLFFKNNFKITTTHSFREYVSVYQDPFCFRKINPRKILQGFKSIDSSNGAQHLITGNAVQLKQYPGM